MNSLEQAKKEFLLKTGWKEIKPEVDFKYLEKIGVDTVAKEFGYLVSRATFAIKENFFNIWSKDLDLAKDEFLQAVCPPVTIPPAPLGVGMVNVIWPLDSDDDTSTRAFEELTYRAMYLIVTEVLGNPKEVYQQTENSTFKYPESQEFNFRDLQVVGNLIAIWDDVYLKIDYRQQWTDNGSYAALDWNMYSNKLRELATKALTGTGLEFNPKTYQVGKLDPEFKLSSFPEYIKTHTAELSGRLGYWDNKIHNAPERLNVLVEGPPGYGKTRWCQAYASEILSPNGYVIMVVDYSSLQDLVIPSYLDKVCIIVNDADTLALKRSISERGETEQVLSWLDGTRSTFIKPYHMERRASIITLLTANSVELWDEAALRKGRIHMKFLFNKVNLSEKSE